MSARTDGPLRFSVVVPAHDEAADLGAALDALLAQDLDAAYEVLVVDNASTDATAEVARVREIVEQSWQAIA